jgi:branched-chain amino acid transport system permease protein
LSATATSPRSASVVKSIGKRLRSLQLNPYVLLVWLAFFLFLALAPTFVNIGVESNLAYFMLWICLAQSFNLFTGLTGYVNFGNVVFYGMGGYGVAIATSLWNMSPLFGVLLGGGFSALLALAMSFPTLRLRGAYFAIATLGIAQAILVIFDNWAYVNRVTGLTLPIPDHQPTQAYYTILVVAALTVIALTIVMKSKLGVALNAIRQQEETALSIGVNATLYKTIAFVLSGFFAGLGGATWIWYLGFIDPPSAFNTGITLTVISMALLGGLGTLFGPVVGAAVLDYIETYSRLSFPYLYLIIFGVTIMVVVLIIPDGILGFAQKMFRRFSPSKTDTAKALSKQSAPALLPQDPSRQKKD